MNRPLSRRHFVVGTAALTASALVPKSLRAASSSATARVVVRTVSEIGVVRPEFPGHFAEHLGSCVYGGLWVGKNSQIPNIDGYRKQAVEYLKELGIPVLRWPGGCFAGDYHWREGLCPAATAATRGHLQLWDLYQDCTSC